MIHDAGMRHVHERKHALEEYPSPAGLKRILDKLVYIGAFYGPIVTIPQVWTIYAHKTTAGLSVFSWGAYILTTVIWLAYGILHKEKPIIVAQILWLIIEILIVVGGLLYG